jgi:hypothetical protein
MNKPSFLTSSELMGLLALSFAATVSLVWIACVIGISAFSMSRPTSPSARPARK